MSPTFAQLGVPESICAALARRGIDRPFEIQAATIADALAGRDVLGRAPTGSGKTLAFGIPLVAAVDRAGPRRPRALVLSPTRELAEQIASELRSFAGAVRVGVVYGGVGIGGQSAALRRGVDILVACPGRLEDLIGQGSVRLDEVDRVVVDEADRMADMGFLPSVTRLLDQTDPVRQTLLFSATLDGDVAELTRRYQRDPVTHEVGEATPDITSADHRFWTVQANDRIDTAARVITSTGRSIVFCRTRHGSDRVARQLAQRGISAAAFHGGHAQNRRTSALAGFAKGTIKALVATDVAARGIHVDGIATVIHYDPPGDHKTYLHRSGRTARAGSTGLVVSLVQADQVAETKRMQRSLGLGHAITGPDLGLLASSTELRTPPSAGATTERRRSTPPPTEQGRRRRKHSGSGPPAGKSRRRHHARFGTTGSGRGR